MFVFAPKNGAESFGKAALGDMVFAAANCTQKAGSGAWAKTIQVRLEDASGNCHDWFYGSIPVAVSDNSTAGTATIKDSATTIRFSRGRGFVTIVGSNHAWVAGEVVTVTVGNTTKLFGATIPNKIVTITVSST